MNQNELKKQAAEFALNYLPKDGILGVGTGSTVNYFIEALAPYKNKIECAVSSSIATETLLKKYNIPTADLNAVNTVDVYVDGADEATPHRALIKGLGGALTREKIIATVAKKFICIIDQNKQVDVLSANAPVPVEVIPLARGYVSRELVKLGGTPVYREGYKTDNGNIILDVFNLTLTNPLEMEYRLKGLTGVVENGIFAKRLADVLVIASDTGVKTID